MNDPTGKSNWSPSDWHKASIDHLIDNISAAFWIATFHWKEVQFTNEGYDAIWQRDGKALCRGEYQWIEAVHPDDRQLVAETMSALPETHSYQLEYRIERPDHSIRWIHDRSVWIPGQSGTADRVAGMGIDVTQRKIAERERDLFFDMSLDLLCIASLDGYFKRVSPSFERTLGFTEDELLGAPFLDFVHPDDRAGSVAAMTALSEGKDVIQFENRYRCRDGSYRWLEWNCPAPLPGEDLLHAVARDVTEHRKATDALEQSEARYREIFESAHDIILTLDLNGVFTSVNKAGEEITGYSRDEIVGNDITLLLDEAGVTKVRQMMQRKLDLGGRTVYEVEITSKSGSRVPIEVHSNVIHENGKPVAFQAIAVDITQRKLYEDQLRSAKEHAESASHAKSDFLANMSHEIRTPMNAVIGMTELVLDSDLNPNQRSYLETVLESAESLMTIIDEVLDFSKIESGKIEPDPVRFNLRDSIGDTLKTMAFRAHQRGLELLLSVDNQIADSLIGDIVQLRQIITNLVGNAIKFTSNGQITVHFRYLEQDDSRTSVECSVADTGIGIPKHKLRKVFEAFEQADPSTTRRYGGTGLGLAICKRLVEIVGGKIWVESELGQGTTFFFSMTFERGAASQAKRIQLPASAAGSSVLIVDDNDALREILAETLGHHGMQVMTADGFKAALRAVEEAQERGHTYSLVITDLQMPDADGFELTRQLRSNPRYTRTPIILLASGSRRGDAARCEDLGIARTILKPVKESEILGTVRDALSAAADDDESSECQASGTEPLGAVMPSLRVLVAEDGRANQQLAVGLLRSWGHAPRLASDGVEALQLVSSEPFDLVLMDIQMPNMDGIEATRRIRELEVDSGRHVPIVAMTAHAMKRDRDLCLKAGMDDYLSKPIRREELHRVLRSLVDPHAATRVPDPVAPQDENSSDIQQVDVATRSVDWTQALSSTGGDRDLLVNVVDASIKELPRLLAGLRNAADSRDRSAMGRYAHTIKGSLRHYGPTRAGEIAESIESSAKTIEISEFDGAYADLSHELQVILQDLTAYHRRFVVR